MINYTKDLTSFCIFVKKHMIEIYDIEIYSNYFLICSIDYSTKERKSFIIDENNNNLEEILEWIKEKNKSWT